MLEQLKKSVSVGNIVSYFVNLNPFIIISFICLAVVFSVSITNADQKNTDSQSGSLTDLSAEKISKKSWYGKLKKHETKNIELNLIFPTVKMYYIRALATAYDTARKGWLGASTYALNVATKNGKDADVQRAYTRPKVTPIRMAGEPGVKATWEDMDDPDSQKTEELHTVIPNPPALGPINLGLPAEKQSVWLELRFASNPKIREPAKLILKIFAPSDFDSILVKLEIPQEVTVLSSQQPDK